MPYLQKKVIQLSDYVSSLLLHLQQCVGGGRTLRNCKVELEEADSWLTQLPGKHPFAPSFLRQGWGIATATKPLSDWLGMPMDPYP